MTKEEFSTLCQSHRLTQVEPTRFAGEERGYPIALTWAGKKSISMSIPASKDAQKLYSGALKTELAERTGKALSAAWGDGYLTIYINTVKIADPYCQGVTAALDILRNIGLTVPDRCQVCGGSGCDAAIPRGAAYTPVHRSCLVSAVAGAKSKAEDSLRSGSYITGIIGAVLGMLVGIIPSTLTIIFANKIYVLLFAIIPFCIYSGYNLLRGKKNYAALVLSIVLSIVGVYALNYISFIYSFMDTLGEYYSLTFKETLTILPALIGSGELFVEITKSSDFIYCLIFVAAGIFLTWGRISRTAASDIKGMDKLSASAIPYGANMADDYIPDMSDYSQNGDFH